jgi:hypothetical protein
MFGIADLFEKFNRIFRERLIWIFLAFDFCHLLLLYLQHLPRVFDADLFFYNLILRISVIDLDP